MSHAFEFATASRIVFGRGRFEAIGGFVREIGRRALVVTGRSSERFDRLEPLLARDQIAADRFVVSGEPTIETVRAGVAAARAAGRCDVVIGLGGGSALDAAKAVAALAPNPGDVLDYLEIIGRGQPFVKPSLPTVAIPTTAGTGSEVTRNAVLGSPAHQVKASLRSPFMLPRLALVDPDLTLTSPSDVTAASGLDALTQLIEAYVSRRANALTDPLCEAGIRHAAGALRRAVQSPDDRDAREAMALASLLSGLALANAGLGAVHGFANPLGGLLDAPHGALCAALVAGVVRANVRALAARAPALPARRRFETLAQLLTGAPSARPEDGAAWLQDLVAALRIPRLSTYGLSTSQIPLIVERAQRANSMKGNPIELTDDELARVLADAL